MGLRELGIPAIAITSLTPKEDISEAMKELDNSSSSLRLVYGQLHLSQGPVHCAGHPVI